MGFPCNQFGKQEPKSTADIVEFVKGYDVKFQLMDKVDVNGASAVDVFVYLKKELPGTFGSFVKWNFTKFLCDRNGKPFKRYGPQQAPFTFEDDIVSLLDQTPDSTEPVAVAAAAAAPV